jgi:hypothetical protein
MAGIRTTLHKTIRNLAQLSLDFRWITHGLAMLASVPAFALGLGDLTVSSSLGQALDARISLLGEPRDLNPDCFKVASSNGDSMALPSDIRLKLEQSRDSASLRIQTRQIINEPAMMFSVSTVCPERIQRDYAVLLDPPASPAAVPVVTGNSGTATANGNKPSVPAKTATKSDRRKAATSSSARTRGNQAASRHPPRRNTGSISEEPRLILSGSRRAYSPESAQLALNMDVSVLDMNRKAEVPLTPAELTDENTALSRKVIHLEQLLASLQKRNAELEQARAKTAHTANAQADVPKKPDDKTGWPYFMLGFALLSGGAAYALYRRRHAPVERFRDTETLAVPASPLSMQPAEEEKEQPTIIKAPRAEQPAAPDIPPSPLAARSNEGTEVKDSVADEVEVFVAHGHSDLAIHMLEDHIEKTPDESPVPWLLLLDLLKRESAEEKYENYRQKIKLHFNVAMPAYGEAEVNLAGHGLESYSHIMSELVRLWPTDQVNAYLDDLIYDRRGGSRMGFDPATYRDIVLLRALRTGSAWKSLV